MNISTWFRRPWVWVAFTLILLAIFLVFLWQTKPAASQENLSITQAYITVAARLTEAVEATRLSAGNPGETQLATAMPVESQPSSTPLPIDRTQTVPADPPQHSPSPTQPCDLAAPGIPMDVTVPDESQFHPGESFTKIWRFQNIGTCTWTGDYAARFFYGDRMSAAEMILLGSEVTPGGVVDIPVDMQAPNEPGSYQGNWKLMNSRGQLFGIGPKGDAPFWVRIVVLRVATQTSTSTITPTPTLTPTPPVTSTATPSPTFPVESAGDLLLKIDQTVDLDTGRTDSQNGQDLKMGISNSFHVLTPQNEAVLGVYGAAQPGMEACQSSGLSKAPIALESLSPGIHLCYRTDLGRYGWLRYVSLNEDSSTNLEYHTWALP